MPKQQTATTVYLTSEEKAMFDQLPDNVRSGCSVETETMTFKDSEEKRAIRMRNMKVTDQRLIKLQRETQVMKSPEALKKAIETFDLTTLPRQDLVELYFAMGPEALSLLIENALEVLRQGEEDASGLSAFTRIRHGLLEAMQQQ